MRGQCVRARRTDREISRDWTVSLTGGIIVQCSKFVEQLVKERALIDDSRAMRPMPVCATIVRYHQRELPVYAWRCRATLHVHRVTARAKLRSIEIPSHHATNSNVSAWRCVTAWPRACVRYRSRSRSPSLYLLRITSPSSLPSSPTPTWVVTERKPMPGCSCRPTSSTYIPVASYDMANNRAESLLSVGGIMRPTVGIYRDRYIRRDRQSVRYLVAFTICPAYCTQK